MQSSGKSNIPGYTRGNSSYNKESKGKVVESKDKEASKDPMKEMAEMMKTLVTNQNQQMANHPSQLNHIQNRLIMMERNHVSHAPRNFQPKSLIKCIKRKLKNLGFQTSWIQST